MTLRPATDKWLQTLFQAEGPKVLLLLGFPCFLSQLMSFRLVPGSTIFNRDGFYDYIFDFENGAAPGSAIAPERSPKQLIGSAAEPE